MLNRFLPIFALSAHFAISGCGVESSSPSGSLSSQSLSPSRPAPDLSSYYAGASSKKGEDLRILLHDIIKGHQFYSYNEVWEILKDTDEDPENSDNVLMFYTGESRPKNGQEGNEEGGGGVPRWNREHVWAKSKGFPRPGLIPYTDAHHLRACDVKLNAKRGNRFFAELKTSDAVSTEGNKIGNRFFEPAKDFRGDVARMILYMDVRYEGGNESEPQLIVSDELGDAAVEEGTARFGKLSDLVRWNEEDPVDDLERARHEKIFKWQKNRNPFIDHPEWVNKIWAAKK